MLKWIQTSLSLSRSAESGWSCFACWVLSSKNITALYSKPTADTAVCANIRLYATMFPRYREGAAGSAEHSWPDGEGHRPGRIQVWSVWWKSDGEMVQGWRRGQTQWPRQNDTHRKVWCQTAADPRTNVTHLLFVTHTRLRSQSLSAT